MLAGDRVGDALAHELDAAAEGPVRPLVARVREQQRHVGAARAEEVDVIGVEAFARLPLPVALARIERARYTVRSVVEELDVRDEVGRPRRHRDSIHRHPQHAHADRGLMAGGAAERQHQAEEVVVHVVRQRARDRAVERHDGDPGLDRVPGRRIVGLDFE